MSCNNDQMRARTKAAAHNLAVLKPITLNLIRLHPSNEKEASNHETSSLLPPTAIVPNSSNSTDDVHAIALYAARRSRSAIGCGCTISLVSTGPQLVQPAAPPERNWMPLAVAAAIVIAVSAGAILIFGHGKTGPTVTPINAPVDPYAASLVISQLAMSQSSNLAGGQVTYVDGHIVNQGSRTVTGITVQVLFRDPAHEVAQNETQPMKFIRMRDPYVDVEPVSAAPLKPGGGQDFRLIFDTLAQDWDGAYPDIRIVHVDTK